MTTVLNHPLETASRLPSQVKNSTPAAGGGSTQTWCCSLACGKTFQEASWWFWKPFISSSSKIALLMSYGCVHLFVSWMLYKAQGAWKRKWASVKAHNEDRIQTCQQIIPSSWEIFTTIASCPIAILTTLSSWNSQIKKLMRTKSRGNFPG